MQRQTGKAGTTGKVLAGLLAGMLSLGATAARAEYCHAIGLDSCPTGATQFCSDNPIRPTDFYQALGACQTCFGVQCFQLPFGTSALTPDRNDFTCNNTFFFWEDSGGSAGSSGSRCYGYPQGSWSDPPACFDGLPSPGEERTDCGGPCTDTPCCNADGVVDAGREDCDDGNAVDGDGCTSCHVDGCYACGGSPSACTVTTGASCADDGNACTLDQCDASAQCVHPANTGAACDDDGNGCTLDRCDATGTCAHDGDIGAACADDGNACTLDQCDASGACVHPAVADGAACDDDSLCTNDDHCSAGTCTGTDTVVCCDGGTCMPDTGACSICPDGYTQDGSYFCSKTYSITAGDLDDVAYTCNPNEAIGLASIGFHWTDPGDPAVGAALDFAIDMGSSYLSTGSSKHVDVQLNGNAIGGYDAAQFESCVGEPINRRFSNLNSAYYTKGATNQVVASWVGSGHGLTADGSGHYAAVTVKYLATPQTPLSDGTACDDGNACTLGDACHAGACNGTNLTCEASDACHLAGTCNPTTGECSNPAALDNLPCDDGNACSTSTPP